jgi:hypothetical protein
MTIQLVDDRILEEFHTTQTELARREDERLRALGWPDALMKAVNDSYRYACQLRTGVVVAFERAAVVDAAGCWVRLHSSAFETMPAVTVQLTTASENVTARHLTFGRGLEVRVADIVWVADAPDGVLP